MKYGHNQITIDWSQVPPGTILHKFVAETDGNNNKFKIRILGLVREDTGELYITDEIIEPIEAQDNN